MCCVSRPLLIDHDRSILTNLHTTTIRPFPSRTRIGTADRYLPGRTG